MKKGIIHAKAYSQKRTWEDYCGFIDKSVEYFLEMQNQLLMRQIEFIYPSGLWKEIVGDICPRSPEEFRDVVPLTTYADYEEIFMGKLEHLLPGKPKVWAHTTGSTGEVKWVPYTGNVYEARGDFFLTAAFLSSSARGIMPMQPGDVFFYTIAPPPYGSGLGVQSALERFSMRVIPPFEEAKEMSFAERIIAGFRMALEIGRIDAIGGIASVLVNIGRMFETSIGDYLGSGESGFGAKKSILEKYVQAKNEGKSLRPKDFFAPKVITCAGADASLFADAVERYWGKRPSECYGSTESGLFAIQPYGCPDMVMTPSVVYLEFIPEKNYNEVQPSTRMTNELEVGGKYEPVVTSFHGGSIFRYRMGDLIEVVSLGDPAKGLDIPTIRFFSRADNVINLSGTVRLNEKACWEIIENADVNYKDWAVIKEFRGERAFIHFFIETFEPKRRVLSRMRNAACRTIATFDEIPEILGHDPLDVTVLTEGTFAQYRNEREAEGADLGQIKPMHVNPKPHQLERLKRISLELKA